MRTPDARPVGETAASPWSMLGDSAAEQSAYDRIYAVIGDCDAIQLDRYLAEYRAACRAALLRDAPVVWVATDSAYPESEVFMREPVRRTDRDGAVFFMPDHGREAEASTYLRLTTQLTPPGTVRRYALLPHPEGEEITDG